MNRFAKLIPSRRWLVFPPILIGVLVVGALARSKQPLQRIDPEELATQLVVRRVYRQSVPAIAIGHGTAKPVRTWTAISEVGGRVLSIHPKLRSGNFIKEGETLLAIDQGDYELQVRQREADVKLGESQLEQHQVSQSADETSLEIQKNLLQVRASDVKRIEGLMKRTAASQGELDAARALLLQQSQTVQNLEGTLATYPSKINSAQASIETAKARLEEAIRNLDRTKIVAPLEGVLQGVTLEIGQYVGRNQTLFQILDTSSVEVEAHFSIQQLSGILKSMDEADREILIDEVQSSLDGNELATEAEGYSMKDDFRDVKDGKASPIGLGFSASVLTQSGDLAMEFAGTPVRFVSSIDEQTRTLGTVIRIDNPPRGKNFVRRVRAGSYCEVLLTSDLATDAFLIPRTSVDNDTVAVLDGENRLRRRPIEIGFALREEFAVTGGLNEGDLVIVNPPAVMMEGELIAPLVQATLADGLPGERGIGDQVSSEDRSKSND